MKMAWRDREKVYTLAFLTRQGIENNDDRTNHEPQVDKKNSVDVPQALQENFVICFVNLQSS
jgi:hypothetical protein